MISVYICLLCLFSLLAFNTDLPDKVITAKCNEFLFDINIICYNGLNFMLIVDILV